MLRSGELIRQTGGLWTETDFFLFFLAWGLVRVCSKLKLLKFF